MFKKKKAKKICQTIEWNILNDSEATVTIKMDLCGTIYNVQKVISNVYKNNYGNFVTSDR